MCGTSGEWRNHSSEGPLCRRECGSGCIVKTAPRDRRFQGRVGMCGVSCEAQRNGQWPRKECSWVSEVRVCVFACVMDSPERERSRLEAEPTRDRGH